MVLGRGSNETFGSSSEGGDNHLKNLLVEASIKYQPFLFVE
jgi:hypothetical protein